MLAPIEFVFCDLAAELSRRCKRDWTMDDLRRNVIAIARDIGQGGIIHSTSIHYEYPF